MRIVVLEGRPNKIWSLNMIPNKFIENSKKSGHSVKAISFFFPPHTHKHISMN